MKFSVALSLMSLLLVACGGDGSGSSPVQYTIGVTTSGLAGTGLMLQLNGGSDLSIASNGIASFLPTAAAASNYHITVAAQPTKPTQECSVSNPIGTVNSSNAMIAVSCITTTYSVGGTVSGLSGSGLVLYLNGADALPVKANEAVTFPAAIASGTAYTVVIATQPTNPSQTCSISNGAGTVGSSSVSNIAVTCATESFSIGATVSGLSGSGLVLSLNGSKKSGGQG